MTFLTPTKVNLTEDTTIVVDSDIHEDYVEEEENPSMAKSFL